MYERSSRPGPRQENFDAFPDHERIEGHWLRGLTVTNNWRLFYLNADTSPTDESSGFPKAYHHANRSFGPIVEQFRTTHADLWDAAQKAAVAYDEAAQADLRRLFEEGDRTPNPDTEAKYWEQAELMHETFHAILPEIEAAEIDPLELCR